jgi:hypothetical protein
VLRIGKGIGWGCVWRIGKGMGEWRVGECSAW